MNLFRPTHLAAAGMVLVLLPLPACQDNGATAPRPPSSTPLPAVEQAGSPPSSGDPKQMKPVDIRGVRLTGKTLPLTGITFSIPEGWIRETAKMNPQMPSASRRAQFRLPSSDNETEDVTIAITHFPGMKGMDQMNLQRWYGQFVQPDGRPTAEMAAKTDFQIGQVLVTLVDIPGTMKASPMMGRMAAKENYRMLAAVIDHAKGPHFFKLIGPASGVERWKASAVAFLKSVKVNP